MSAKRGSFEDFAGVSRTGRALTRLRTAHLFADHVDKLLHHLAGDKHPGDRHACRRYDDHWLQRLVHDHDFRADVAVNATDVFQTAATRVALGPAPTFPARAVLGIDSQQRGSS